MDAVVAARLRVFLSDTEPDGLLVRAARLSDVDLVVFLVFLAPSCFLEPPAGMTHEAVQCHRKFQHPEGDHFTLINIYNAFKQSQREQCKAQFKFHTAALLFTFKA